MEVKQPIQADDRDDNDEHRRENNKSSRDGHGHSGVVGNVSKALNGTAVDGAQPLAIRASP